ncbi:uncharacterized protein LOC133792526 [Humulus lupulus]|uniref:uncharacterized protein LOC133792526 n=1 Tax=Humulus lupulus TaxID=3486 RepID=UPI002B401178|nr:uncharacterized protein LOC133792526 [Humulus lupulus]
MAANQRDGVNNNDGQNHIAQDQNVRALRYYVLPAVTGVHSCIRPPTVTTNNFEIKSAMIQMVETSVQFGGLPNEDPNLHIVNFLELCAMFKFNGWPVERDTSQRKVAGVHELDAIAALTAQLASLTKQLQQNKISAQAQAIQMQSGCEICGGPHLYEHCTAANIYGNIPVDQAQVQAVGNFQRPYQNSFSNTYNPGWRNHPNFSWRNNQGQQSQFQGPYQQNMSQQPMNQASSSHQPRPQDQPENPNDLQAALLTLTNT